jgi:type IV pilus assembly protein PilW
MTQNRKRSMAIGLPRMSGCDSRQSQAGLTLLEIMISLSLGLLLLTGIGTIYVGSNQTYRVQEQNARIQEAGRYALEVIGRSLRQAGYWNVPINATANQTAFTGTPITSATPATTFTVQYDGDGATVTDCSGATPAMITETYDLNANNLRCTASNVTSPLISNVEELQFLYGIDTDNDRSADQYTAAPGNWNQVISVRACILIRSQDQGITTSGQPNMSCAVALGTAATSTAVADTRLRRTFVATFNLRNRVP